MKHHQFGPLNPLIYHYFQPEDRSFHAQSRCTLEMFAAGLRAVELGAVGRRAAGQRAARQSDA